MKKRKEKNNQEQEIRILFLRYRRQIGKQDDSQSHVTTTHRCLDLLEQLRTKNDFIKYEVRLSTNPSKTSTISQSVQAKVMDHSHHRAFVTNYLNKNLYTYSHHVSLSVIHYISRIRNNTEMPLLALLFNILLKAQPRTLRQEK